MATPQIIADFEVQLATAISPGGTSFTLSSNEDDDGNTIPDGLYYFTVDNGTSAKEYLSGTLSGLSVTGVKTVSRQGVEVSGAARAHRVGAQVIITDFATYKAYIDDIAIAGASNASTSAKGIVEIALAAEIDAGTGTGGTGAPIATTPDQLELSKYNLQLPSVAEKAALAGLGGLTGAILPYAGRSAPSGYLLCDGSLVSRSTYAALFAVISPSQAATFSNGSPNVTMTAHGLVVGDQVHFTTSGTLPTNFTTAVTYYVKSVGDANTVTLALSPGGTQITAGSAGSGTHTVYKSAWGMGDGSTTFTLPDFRSRVPVGLASAAPTTQKLSFEPGAVSTGSDNVTILDSVFPSQGQKIQLTSTGSLPTGLSTSTDYWIVRTSATTIQFAASQADANAATPVVINITGQGTGVHTMTYTGAPQTVLGRMGGEETHGLSAEELAAHTHISNGTAYTSGVGSVPSGSGNPNLGATAINNNNTPANRQHNIMQPFATVNFIIKT